MSAALPLVYSPCHDYPPSYGIQGTTWKAVEGFGPDSGPIRQMERASIRWWMESQRAYLTGRVLDFGAGKPGTCREPQPYRDLVAGEYVPYDVGDQLPGGYFDAVMCNQVLQYVPDPQSTLTVLWQMLRVGGHLVMTFPTNWAECEVEDKWRWTAQGMEALLSKDVIFPSESRQQTGLFQMVKMERRAEVRIGSFSFPLGYGVVARKV